MAPMVVRALFIVQSLSLSLFLMLVCEIRQLSHFLRHRMGEGRGRGGGGEGSIA